MYVRLYAYLHSTLPIPKYSAPQQQPDWSLPKLGLMPDLPEHEFEPPFDQMSGFEGKK